GVIGLNPGSGLFKVGAVTGFIAQGPHNDAGAVFIPLYIPLYPVQNRICKAGVLSQEAEHMVFHGVVVVISQPAEIVVDGLGPVHFNVGLVNDIEAKPVVQLGSPWGIGVMAG